MKHFLFAVFCGVVVGLIGVWVSRFFFGEDLVGAFPAFAGGVAGFVLVSLLNARKKDNG